MTISRFMLGFAPAILALGFFLAPANAPAQIEFGDDDSRWANDGECDDPRFEGRGSDETLLEEDRGHDATDCRTLFDRGRIKLRPSASPAANGSRIEHGRLERGDDTLRSGEYADTYVFEGRSGNRALIGLRSDDFDPYLLVRTPSGTQFDNDDYDGDASRSLLSLDIAENGMYTVIVTSYDEGETGGYTLDIEIGQAPPAPARGTLVPGDDTLTTAQSR